MKHLKIYENNTDELKKRRISRFEEMEDIKNEPSDYPYQEVEPSIYYAIRWLNLSDNKYGECEGRFSNLKECMDYINNEKFPIENFNREFTIVKIDESPVDIEDIKMNLEIKKFNL